MCSIKLSKPQADDRKIRDKLKELLPDPNHPWRNPLRNSPLKWHEMIDISDNSDEEDGVSESKYVFTLIY